MPLWCTVRPVWLLLDVTHCTSEQSQCCCDHAGIDDPLLTTANEFDQLFTISVCTAVSSLLNKAINQRLAQHFYCTRSPFYNLKSSGFFTRWWSNTNRRSLEAQVQRPLENQGVKDKEGVRKLATKEEFLTVTQRWSKLSLISPRSTPNTNVIESSFSPASALLLVQIWRIWLKGGLRCFTWQNYHNCGRGAPRHQRADVTSSHRVLKAARGGSKQFSVLGSIM